MRVNWSDPAGNARKHFTDENLVFPNLLDPGRLIFRKYGAGGIPKIVLIDRNGIVRYFQQGRSSNQDFPAEVKKLL